MKIEKLKLKILATAMTGLMLLSSAPLSITARASSVNYNPSLDSTTVSVPPITGLANDFIKGMDVSMIEQIEDNGGKYYDNGSQEDPFKILKNHGVNWVRLRIWNNPTQGGGNNDETTTILLAKRAKAAGLKVLLDFHYSDFWADPGSQTIPAVWKGHDYATLENDVYSFTKQVLTDMKDKNALPDMVQIGNEINSGMMWPAGKDWGDGSGGFDELAKLLNSGAKAVREIQDPGKKIKIMIHLANGYDNGAATWFFDEITKRNVDFDVIGFSFYQASIELLQQNVNDVSKKYNKEVAVAETSYGYTLKNADKLENSFGQAQVDAAGYPATPQGQASSIRDVMKVISQVPDSKGLGVFYWGGEWIPQDGAGWKNSEGNGYENQALFDFNGNALPSLDVFKKVSNNSSSLPKIASLPKVKINASGDPTAKLPKTLVATYTDGSYGVEYIKWDAIDPSKYAETGIFIVKGRVEGTDATTQAVVTVIKNEVKNPSFESINSQGWMAGDLSNWTLTGTGVSAAGTSWDSSTKDGSYKFNSWSSDAFDFILSQNVTNIQNGTYTMKAWVKGGGGAKDVHLFADNGADEKKVDISLDSVWTEITISNIQVTNGQCDVGMHVESLAGGWWTLDDVQLYRAPEKIVTDVTTSTVSTNAGIAPVLPQQVSVIYSDDSTANLPVTWDSITADKYASKGSFAVEGSIAGTDIKAEATVNVGDPIITALKAVDVSTEAGTAPVLPSKVTASYSDGTTSEVNVTWANLDASTYAKKGNFNVDGTVVGTAITVKAKITVVLPSIIQNSNEKVINALATESLLSVDATSNPLADKSVFDTIKGTDKTVTFEQKDSNGAMTTSWSFNGNDINQTTTNVDLRLSFISKNAEAISKKVSNYDVLPISFTYEGVLPGKATVKVKLSDAWLKGKDRNNIYIYHFDPSNNSTDLIAKGLKVDENGYVQFNIYHCSDYFVADKDITTIAQTTSPTTASNSTSTTTSNTTQTVSLPKTGSFADTSVLVVFGVIIAFAGIGITFKRKLQ